jgi:hypothetical protein
MKNKRRITNYWARTIKSYSEINRRINRRVRYLSTGSLFSGSGEIRLGILLGIFAGIIDILLMVAQSLTWNANLSAFSLLGSFGLFYCNNIHQTQRLSQRSKHIISDFTSLSYSYRLEIPIHAGLNVIMTLVLGSLLGFLIEKYGG